MFRSRPFSSLVVASVLAACSGSMDPTAPLATVSVEILQSPSDALCLRLVAAGVRSVVRTENLTPGQTTIFNLSLAAGSTTFAAEAFPQSCAATSFENPSYLSDQVNVVLMAGDNPPVTLTMRGRARVPVQVDWPGDPRGIWVGFNGSPPGTRAVTRFDPSQSTASRSVFEIVVPGYFLLEVIGPDGRRYTHLTVPGLGEGGDVGAPRLPVARLELAVPSDVKETLPGEAEILESVRLPAVLPLPHELPEVDHPGATGPKFARDEKIYGGSEPYPRKIASTSPVDSKLGSIRGFTATLALAGWDPKSGALTLATRARFQLSHPSDPGDEPRITLERQQAAALKFANWATISQYILPNALFFAGNFLFVYPTGYADELLPLVQQKKARGFSVTEVTIPASGNTCASIRGIIEAWYDARPAGSDKYAILVGDTDVIPLCTAPTGDPTDDLYGSTNGDDLDEEVHVGRLSVDSQADAATQVAKILMYSDHPSRFFNYSQVLLTAHLEGAPGKYVGAHESVRTASYTACPPIFRTLYGNVPGVDDADVTDDVDGGEGLVAYRGHGDWDMWWQWNTFGQHYDNADVSGLANSTVRTPVVWSFACNNAELDRSDSIAETWMETSRRAVAHYGATVPSYTTQNHELDRQMFRAVFGSGLFTHARAIEQGEAQMAAISGGSENAWMYLLLGDPEMRIRCGAQLGLILEIPAQVTICPVGGCNIRVQVRSPEGLPVQGALVSAWKGPPPSPIGARAAGGGAGTVEQTTPPPDEVFDNRYSDKDGFVEIPASPQTGGTLYVAARTLDGGDALGEIPVK